VDPMSFDSSVGAGWHVIVQEMDGDMSQLIVGESDSSRVTGIVPLKDASNRSQVSSNVQELIKRQTSSSGGVKLLGQRFQSGIAQLEAGDLEGTIDLSKIESATSIGIGSVESLLHLSQESLQGSKLKELDGSRVLLVKDLDELGGSLKANGASHQLVVGQFVACDGTGSISVHRVEPGLQVLEFLRRNASIQRGSLPALLLLRCSVALSGWVSLSRGCSIALSGRSSVALSRWVSLRRSLGWVALSWWVSLRSSLRRVALRCSLLRWVALRGSLLWGISSLVER